LPLEEDEEEDFSKSFSSLELKIFLKILLETAKIYFKESYQYLFYYYLSVSNLLFPEIEVNLGVS
jgi:hypothetical protein